MDLAPPKQFRPDVTDTSGESWKSWKQQFRIYIAARDLEKANGRRLVNMLLHLLGPEGIKLYNTFEFRPEVPAVDDKPKIPAESPDDLETVITKFDAHYGHKKYRAIKRQAFLDRRQEEGETLMEFVTDIKLKVKDCEYGAAEESVLIDKIINGVNDRHVKTKLLDLEDSELTLINVIKVCRTSELTQKHLDDLTSASKAEKQMSVNFAGPRGGPNFRGRSRSRGRARTRAYHHNTRPRGQWGHSDRSTSRCFKCERQHEPGLCSAADKYCGRCGSLGHFSRSRLCTGMNNNPSYRHERGVPRGQPRRPYRGFQGHRRGDNQSINFTNCTNDQYYCNDKINAHENVYVNDCYDYENYENEMCELFDNCVVDEYEHEFQTDAYTCKVVNNCNKECITDDDEKWVVKFKVEGKVLQLEIDTGARCNIIGLESLKLLNTKYASAVKPSKQKIQGVLGKAQPGFGKINLPCEFNGKIENLEFQIIPGSLNLLSRYDSVRLNLVKRIHMTSASTCNPILTTYQDVFEDRIGCVPGEVGIELDEGVQPKVCPPRSIPVALRQQVKDELDRLEKEKIIAKVTEPTSWVNPLVCVKKPSGKVRLCIDPFQLNKAIRREHYPMNTIDDTATRLGGSKYFSVLDANMGFYQVKLNQQSSYYTTFSTPFGRYRHLRMPMGISSAPEIFQRVMSDIFGDLDGVEINMDDLLVHGHTLQEHNIRLERVLRRARDNGLQFNRKKTKIAQQEVDYVGHKITAEGLKPTADRIQALQELSEPQSFAELESVLGMLAYVSKFIPNLSEMNAPLRELKVKKVWQWNAEHSRAFKCIKEVLCSSPCLKYYNVTEPILISVDASAKGLGAAAIQADGVVAYASRALTNTEQRYAQIEKEMLAVVFGCQRFHKLIYGKSDVIIQSDHKPLEALSKKPLHKAPMRIQKMKLKLQPYTFELVYVRGKDIGLADCLSRLSRKRPPKPGETLDDDLMVCVAETTASPRYKEIAKGTQEDFELQAVRKVIFTGWPERKADVPQAATRYWHCRDELSTYNGIVFRGDRICVPRQLQKKMLKAVHMSHMGIVKTKQLARDIVYWPGMNSQIEDLVSRCPVCLEHRNKNAREPMQEHPVPDRMWSKIGADLFQLGRKSYIVLVDYYSGFIELGEMIETTAFAVIKFMKEQMARYGVPKILITDGGPQFSSREFKAFASQYGFTHDMSSPEHQQANGLAENAVKQMKNLIKKTNQDGGDLYLNLLNLRNTPRDEEIGSPAQRLMSRRTQTQLPTSEALLKPRTLPPAQVHRKLLQYREKQKHYYDRGTKPLPPLAGSKGVRMYWKGGWRPAEYIGPHALPRSHVIRAGNEGRFYRRNRRMLLQSREQPHKMEPIGTYHRSKPSKPRTVPIMPQHIPVSLDQQQGIGDLQPTQATPERPDPQQTPVTFEPQQSPVTHQQEGDRAEQPDVQATPRPLISPNTQPGAVTQPQNTPPRFSPPPAQNPPTRYSRYGRQIKQPSWLRDYSK